MLRCARARCGGPASGQARYHTLERARPVGRPRRDSGAGRDDILLTGGGVTAGIDFELTIVAELPGQAAAEAIKLSLEYAPAPPFSVDTPGEAPPTVLAVVRARSAAMRAEREKLKKRSVSSLSENANNCRGLRGDLTMDSKALASRLR